MRQDSPITVPQRRGVLRRIPGLCRILALGLAVSMLASGRPAQAAPRGTAGSLYPQKTALDALAGGEVGQRGGTICPEPPGVFPTCGPIAQTDCVTGTPGEECWPTSVFHVPAGPLAIQCDCFGQGATCGPIVIVIDPVAGLRYSCESLCTNPGEECLVFVNSVSSGATSVTSGQLNIDDVITCECPEVPPNENWVIADDFCLEGCDRCECDVNGDGTCDLNDLAFMQNCFGSTDPACRAADVNCDGIVTTADVGILQCFFAGGTAADCCPGAGAEAVIDRVRWYGSYFDPDFEPPTDGTDPLRRPDSWLIAIHTDIPATPCPPPPVGSMSVDWCGDLELCPGTTNLVFRPEGSAFTYSLDDPNNLLAGFGAGDRLRVCGHQPVIITPPCANTIGFVVIDAVSTCQSKVSRPDRLIAQWVIPDPLVTVDPTGKAGWDNHRIFCYTADLGCLVHDFSDPGEIDSMGNFHPVPGKTYWISIQSAVGHTVDPATCTEFATGQTVNQDYWGWHTTPPGHQHKDDAYMGQLAMGCEGEWIYNWMSHLHSSQEPFKDCADDPTKSIDMAFYLLDAEGSTCSVTDTPCQVDSNCPAGETCDEIVHWCQPVNPGTPIIATPVPFPNDAIDELALTIADVQVNLDFIEGTLDLHFEGPTVVWRGIEHEDIGRSHCKGCWATEMVSMDLAGTDPSLGDCTLRVTPLGSSGKDGVRSTGSTTPSATGCDCLDADWDLHVEVECEIGPDGSPFVVVVETPIHLTAQIFEVPPMNVTFVSDPQPVVLIDRATLQPVGTIKSATHFIPYKGGVNVHSHVDWANTPTEECCEPLPDGSDCEQVVCPDPLEECVPVEYACSGVCLSTGAVCTTDAECMGEVCTKTCIVTDCDCQRPDKCHAFADTTLPDPVFCVNSCPPGQICERVEIDTDTPPDGVPDRFRCRCVEDDPLFCPLPPPSGVVDPCQQLQTTDCITDVFNGEECLPRFIVNASGTGFVDGCDCFTPNTDECGPIDFDQLTGDISCSGLCPPLIPGVCVIIVDGTSLGISTSNMSNPAIPDGAKLWCDCHPVDPDGACCLDADSDGIDETCIITTDADCTAQGGSFHGVNTTCGTIGACCLDTDGDGRSETCIEMDSTCCDDAGGTFLGTGAICEGDLNGNGIDDACDCDVLPGERIVLRSGNGAVGGFDTAITVWQGVATLPLSLFPFTAVDFFHACVLGPANVIAPNPVWLAGSAGVLPSDPLAQWIGPNPNSAGGVGIIGQPESALFCQPFDVCCPDITTATITISFAADDQVGDIPFGPNNVGVYINGTAQPGFWGVGFGSEITLSAPAFGLASGPNNLQVYLRDVHAVASGLIYSVTIDVDCALEACCFPDGTCEDLDPCCCVDLGGLPQGAGSDCTTADCGNGDDFCPLPSAAGVVDPCDGRQLTDCFSDSANQLCLPICYENEVQLDGTVVPVATRCDCIEGDECGPVKTQTVVGGTTEFVCDPTNCPIPGDECWIHINGSPIGAPSIATSAVPIGSEVKCKCAHDEGIPCPTPLPPTDDICGTLQSTQCLDGVVNEFCRPVCVEVEQVPGGLGVVATLCECVDKESCGPVTVTDLPNPPGGQRLTCDPTMCLDPLETCQVHINGSPTGQPSIDVNNLSPGTEVKCKCADTPFDPCPTEQAPALDPCGPLQATDCADGAAGEVCRPICVDVNFDIGLPVITATSCDCVGGDECGPVRVLGFLLICDPTNCPTPGEQCSIHINGSPTGQLTFNGASLAANSEAKCKCSAVIDDPCPTENPPALDLCGTLQATDCIDGVAGETCLALCVEVVNDPAVGPMPVATVCDCISGDECGPVRTIDDGITVRLFCEPNVCQDADECQIHINGSPTGSGTIDAVDVPANSEVKCKCTSSVQFDPCPTPLPPSDDPCGLLQPTDCQDGLAGELCLPICLVIEQDATGLVPIATVCDCREGGCGPILIDDFPGGTTGLRCNPDPCTTPGDFCQPHVNGVAQGASSVIVSDLVPGDEVKCQCPVLIATPIPVPAPDGILKNRYISIDPRGAGGANLGKDFDIKVTLTGSLVNGQLGNGPWWANPPDANCISVVVQTQPGVPTNWDACPILHLTGCPIIPTSDYDIVAVLGGTDSAPPLAASTQAKPGVKWHGDCVGFFTGTEWTVPNGQTSIDDAVAAIKTFQNPGNTPGCGTPPCNATHTSVTDMVPNLTPGPQINKIVNIADVFAIIQGFQGLEYPGPDLTQCP